MLGFNDKQVYVEGIRFEILSIDGYGPDPDPQEAGIYIQSKTGTKKDIWYKLTQPAARYRAYYQPFLWLAGFARYFVAYLLNHKNVTLNNFRQDFYQWVSARCSIRASFSSLAQNMRPASRLSRGRYDLH